MSGCTRVQAKAVAMAGVQRVAEFNRRTLDGLAARLYFYYSLAHERTGTLAEIRRCSRLLSLFCTADALSRTWLLRCVTSCCRWGTTPFPPLISSCGACTWATSGHRRCILAGPAIRNTVKHACTS